MTDLQCSGTQHLLLSALGFLQILMRMINKTVFVAFRLVFKVKELYQVVATRKNNTGYYTCTSNPFFLTHRRPEYFYSDPLCYSVPLVVRETIFVCHAPQAGFEPTSLSPDSKSGGPYQTEQLGNGPRAVSQPILTKFFAGHMNGFSPNWSGRL